MFNNGSKRCLWLMLLGSVMIGTAACGTAALPTPTDIPIETATLLPIISPEATAIPEQAVFTMPGHCMVSPDETVVASARIGVFDLLTGQKHFELNDYPLGFSDDGRYLAEANVGVYEVSTGELVYRAKTRRGIFSPDGRLYTDYVTVFDLTQDIAVYTLPRTIPDYITNRDFAYFIQNGRALYYSDLKDVDTEQYPEFDGKAHEVIVDTTTWQTIFDSADYIDSSVNFAFHPTGISYAVSGVGVFSYPERKKLFDLPKNGRTRYSIDGHSIGIMTEQTITETFEEGGVTHHESYTIPKELLLIDSETGEQINRFPHPPGSEVWNLSYITLDDWIHDPYDMLIISDDFNTVIMPDFAPLRVNAPTPLTIVSWQIIDSRSGRVRGTLPPSEHVTFLTDAQDIIWASGYGLYTLDGIRRLIYTQEERDGYRPIADAGWVVTQPTSHYQEPHLIIYRKFDFAPWFLERYGSLSDITADGRWIAMTNLGLLDTQTGRYVLELNNNYGYMQFTEREHYFFTEKPCTVWPVP